MEKKNLKKYQEMKKMEPREVSLDLTQAVSDLRGATEENESDLFLKEARDSLETASQLIDSIMSGRQIDVAFFKLYAANKQERARFLKRYASNLKKRKK